MPDIDPLFQFFNEVGIIAQLAETEFERVMPESMTMAQFILLNHFVRLGMPKSPAELARAFQVTKATMTSTVKRAESKGLVSVTPDPDDGRVKRIFITEAGRAMHGACLAGLKPRLDRLRPLLAGFYLPRLTAELSRMRDVLDKARD